MNCSPPGSSVHGILQARILEWVAISFSRGSSRPRNQAQVSCTTGRFFTKWATRVILPLLSYQQKTHRINFPGISGTSPPQIPPVKQCLPDCYPQDLEAFQERATHDLYIYIYIYFFFFFGCTMWDPSSLTRDWRIEPAPPSVEAQSPDHWTAG